MSESPCPDCQTPGGSDDGYTCKKHRWWEHLSNGSYALANSIMNVVYSKLQGKNWTDARDEVQKIVQAAMSVEYHSGYSYGRKTPPTTPSARE